jgi:hypothetical protein
MSERFERRWTLERLAWTEHQLAARHTFGEHTFSTSWWYPDVDLRSLDRRFGRRFMERVHLHTALFEGMKLTSLRPSEIDLGPYRALHTEALERLMRAVFDGVWAQWRYENDLPDERLPRFAHAPAASRGEPIARPSRARESLLFCGGGKDSLVAMKLFERAGEPFATFGYASSVYGSSAAQFALLDGLLNSCATIRRHRQAVLEDFSESLALALLGPSVSVRTTTACETPASVFAAIPIALDRGYQSMVLGHEASANRPNLRWSRTGEEINHQWGKSLAAEALLDEYVRAELVTDLSTFSALMPLHDVLIFELARRDEALVYRTHSCNVRKPWCKRCPKCAYVWLGMRAHLASPATTDEMFGEDLLEAPENDGHFRALVGLTEHTPFECVGMVEESRLAVALMGARGLLGPRGRALFHELGPSVSMPVPSELLRAHVDSSRMPPALRARIEPLLREAEEGARRRIIDALGDERQG